MISTEQWPRSSLTQTEPDDPFEQLRAAFHLRLRSDAVRLAVLAAALARADADPAIIFEDIRLFAHRVRGAAALFGAPDIGSGRTCGQFRRFYLDCARGPGSTPGGRERQDNPSGSCGALAPAGSTCRDSACAPTACVSTATLLTAPATYKIPSAPPRAAFPRL